MAEDTKLAEIMEAIEDLKSEAPEDKLTIGLISGDLDKILAAFIIALGAVAYDMEVDMFFSFWSISALRDPKKSAKKNFLSKMFGWMLPNGSKKLPLSRMNMAGMGPKMIRGLMKSKGVPSLEEMIKQAGEFGVRINICEMSMDLMGFKAEEMIDYPHMNYCGVATFIDMASSSKATFFL